MIGLPVLTGVGAQTDDVAGVRRDFGSEEDDCGQRVLRRTVFLRTVKVVVAIHQSRDEGCALVRKWPLGGCVAARPAVTAWQPDGRREGSEAGVALTGGRPLADQGALGASRRRFLQKLIDR